MNSLVMKINGDTVDSRIDQIPYLGSISQIRDVANDNQIEDIIIALSTGNSEAIAKIVSDLEDLNSEFMCFKPIQYS